MSSHKSINRGKPITATPLMQERVKKEITRFFKDELFLPLLRTIRQTKKTYFNAKTSALEDAILRGRVQYARGIFAGNFSAAISRELRTIGAGYDSRIKAYRMGLHKLPPNIQAAIAQARVNFETLNKNIVDTLDDIHSQLELKLEELNFSVQYEEAIKNIDNQFDDTVKKNITISADLTPEMKKKIASEYSENLKKYVKDFSSTETLKMRKMVEGNFFSGYRAEGLEDIIKKRFSVADNKARFLARQETNLLTAKYRELRYKDAGLTKYEWSTTPHGGSGVRPDHAALNGRIFSFDDPPIVDKATGRRANPGEDYNCYCKALPVFD